MNYNSADEEEAAEPPLTTVLIIGRSSTGDCFFLKAQPTPHLTHFLTGKTSLVRALLREYEHFDKVSRQLVCDTCDYKIIFRSPMYSTTELKTGLTNTFTGIKWGTCHTVNSS
jgi:hypothetical protein